MSVLVRFEGGRAAHRYKKGHVNLMAQIVLCGDGDGKEKLLQFNLIKGRPSTLLIYYVVLCFTTVTSHIIVVNITAFYLRGPGM